MQNYKIHDPKGKVRIRLRDHITGGASFSKCGVYRPLLWRDWAEEGDDRRVLWIGMNPSTADADVDDPTVRRECDFTAAWGYSKYRKCNVMDYRATHPSDLLTPGVEPNSPENLKIIEEEARAATLIILAYGSLNSNLSNYGTNVEKLLQSLNLNIFCLGRNKNGSPKHPLYLAKTTSLQKYVA